MKSRTAVKIALALVLALLIAVTSCAWRGPPPTAESVEAVTGPFAIATTTVPTGHGFGGGTIYYPTDTSQGRFGGVAVVPGYTAPQATISWYGPRIASQGFVVITIDTNSPYDLPPSRGDQLLAALDYLTTASSVAGRVDAGRLAVMGWSMGGGGSLEAAKKRPSLKAAIPLAPWHNTKTWSTVTVPTLVVGCEHDTVAPVASHSLPFYNSLTAVSEKAYLEIDGGDHYCVISPKTTIARSAISWLKRFVDFDGRYSQFLCPPPSDPAISQYLETCPV